MAAYEENDGGRLPLTWAQTKRMPMTQLVSLPVTCTPPLPALQCTRLCRRRRVAPRSRLEPCSCQLELLIDCFQ